MAEASSSSVASAVGAIEHSKTHGPNGGGASGGNGSGGGGFRLLPYLILVVAILDLLRKSRVKLAACSETAESVPSSRATPCPGNAKEQGSLAALIQLLKADWLIPRSFAMPWLVLPGC